MIKDCGEVFNSILAGSNTDEVICSNHLSRTNTRDSKTWRDDGGWEAEQQEEEQQEEKEEE